LYHSIINGTIRETTHLYVGMLGKTTYERNA